MRSSNGRQESKIEYIDYVVTIPLAGFSGKSKATREKVKALRRYSKTAKIYSVSDLTWLPARPSFARIFMLEFSYSLRQIFSRRKPDVIMARCHIGWGPLFVGRIKKVPVFFEIHADSWDEAKVMNSGKKIKLFLEYIRHRIQIYLFRRSAGLIFNNPRLENFFKQNYRGLPPTVSVYNGADTKEFFPENMVACRRELDLPSGKKILLFVGSLSRWHGVHYLIGVANALKKKRDDFKLVIVGGSQNKFEDLIKRANVGKPQIVWVPEVSSEVARKYINAADACLLPVDDIRVSPGSPLKLYDYVACGKPVIAQSNMEGYSDVVERYRLGISCDFKDFENAASRIDGFISTFQEQQFRVNNRSCAENYLSWDSVILDWMVFAQSVVQSE